MTSQDIGHSWRRIESWLRRREQLRTLAPPATAADLAAVERRCGVKPPRDLVELLRHHNGSGSFTLPPVFAILSTTELIAHWEIKVEIWSDHPYSPFRASFLPFASDGAGGVLHLDTAPGGDGRVQAHDREGGSLGVTDHPMWDSLPSLMHHTAETLESGHALDGYLPPGEESDFLIWEDDLWDDDTEDE
ncbi:SMI1/KNR4 family protein [Streptomyces sp. NPDC002187]|uniref:SMI1/KNR4 family protein n=1 Tax=Streptomyces sp. NPDC002187 TaxID=3364637 RepID=UPI0036B69B35